MLTNAEYATSLRLIADWFESHPEVKPPHDAHEIVLYNVHTRAEMETVARNMGSCEKEYTEGFFKLKKQIGAIELRAVASRDQVCKKRIVGTRIVPEQVISEHVEELVEWECFDKPLLAPPSAPLAKAGGAS